jgi:SNF family Na+-dependent transporter
MYILCFENLTFFHDITPALHCMISLAVGFGNVWRFPSLAYEYGGGAFFIPYLLALFVIGIPMLFLEILLGQVYQRGDISVFAVCHKSMRGVGVASVACGFMVRFLDILNIMLPS